MKDKEKKVLDAVKTILETEGFPADYETHEVDGELDSVTFDLGFRKAEIRVRGDGALWMAKDLLDGVEKTL